MTNKQAADILEQVKHFFSEYQKSTVTKREAAEKLKVSERTIDRMAARGELPKIKVPDTNAVRFPKGHLDILFNKKVQPAAPAPVKTTFANNKTDKKLAPLFGPHFTKPVELLLPENTITLSAVGCWDPTNPNNGEIKKFLWEFLKGSPNEGKINGPDKESAECTGLVLGDYKVRLTLTGSTGLTASSEFILKVKMPPKPKPSDPAAKPDHEVAADQAAQKFSSILFRKPGQ